MSNSNLMFEAKVLIQRGMSPEDAYSQVLKDAQKQITNMENQIEKCKSLLTHDEIVKIFFNK